MRSRRTKGSRRHEEENEFGTRRGEGGEGTRRDSWSGIRIRNQKHVLILPSNSFPTLRSFAPSRPAFDFPSCPSCLRGQNLLAISEATAARSAPRRRARRRSM